MNKKEKIVEILKSYSNSDGYQLVGEDSFERVAMDISRVMKSTKSDYTQEEEIIREAILNARKIQEYLWGEQDIVNQPFDKDNFVRVFSKRVVKISQVDMTHPSATVELRKRILQQAALSIMALTVLDKENKKPF